MNININGQFANSHNICGGIDRDLKTRQIYFIPQSTCYQVEQTFCHYQLPQVPGPSHKTNGEQRNPSIPLVDGNTQVKPEIQQSASCQLPTASWICKCGLCVKSAKDFIGTIRNSNGVYGATVSGAGPSYQAFLRYEASQAETGTIFYAWPGVTVFQLDMVYDGASPQARVASQMSVPNGGMHKDRMDAGSYAPPVDSPWKYVGSEDQLLTTNGYGYPISNGYIEDPLLSRNSGSNGAATQFNEAMTNGVPTSGQGNPEDYIPNGYANGYTATGYQRAPATLSQNRRRNENRAVDKIGNGNFREMNGNSYRYGNQYVLYTIPENSVVAPFPTHSHASTCDHPAGPRIAFEEPEFNLTNGEGQRKGCN